MRSTKNQETRQTVRKNLTKQLSSSGLLEYHCPTPACDTQIFATWEIDLTCNHCGHKVQSLYSLQKPWLK